MRTLAGSSPVESVLQRDSYTAYGDFGGVYGRGPVARLTDGPIALAPDSTVFFAEGNAIRRLSLQGEITTWSGSLTDREGSHRDEPAAEARFDRIDRDPTVWCKWWTATRDIQSLLNQDILVRGAAGGAARAIISPK
jgi:hypothetical protein